MGIFILVFVIGVLDVALGYALAVYLGYGPRTLADAWRALGVVGPIEETGNGGPGAIQAPPQEPHPQQTLSAPRGPSPPAPEKAPDPAQEREPIDVDTFRRFVATSASNLTGFAARLKRTRWGDNQRTAWAFVAELQEICQPYLEKLQQATEQLSAQLADSVQETVLGQVAQLETTLSNLEYMDFDSGMSAAIGRLSQEAANTLSLARTLQQALAPPSEAADAMVSELWPQSLPVEPAVPG